MPIDTNFLETAALAAGGHPGPRCIRWPVPGNLGGFLSFANFAEWRDFWLEFNLPAGVRNYVLDVFDRGRKLHLLAWIDFDLMSAGEMDHPRCARVCFARLLSRGDAGEA
jgi:hypothetical protein